MAAAAAFGTEALHCCVWRGLAFRGGLVPSFFVCLPGGEREPGSFDPPQLEGTVLIYGYNLSKGLRDGYTERWTRTDALKSDILTVLNEIWTDQTVLQIGQYEW